MMLNDIFNGDVNHLKKIIERFTQFKKSLLLHCIKLKIKKTIFKLLNRSCNTYSYLPMWELKLIFY